MKKIRKAVAALMLMTAVFIAAGCSKPDEPNNGGDNNGGNNNGGNGGGTINHEYVDLGLPSGTLWATCNVGANAPEEYGDYLAWGETEPKTTYNWDTYKYSNGFEQLTKYCNDDSWGYNGFTDNLTTLQSTDDAATANWGSGWCMPTYEQWEELHQNTSNTWTTQNGVNGRLYTASNGNSLFLPAAGEYLEDECHGAGGWGGFWSRSLHVDTPRDAFFLYINSDRSELSYDDRNMGFSVRPVRSPK